MWVDTTREGHANETSGEQELALLGIRIGESQLRIPRFEPETMFSNMVSLVYVELGYHAETPSLAVMNNSSK